MGSLAKRWTITINNPTDEEINWILSTPVGREHPISYLIFARETAPTTGTPHLQGYIETTKRLRTRGVTSLGVGLHRAAVFNSKGSADDNIKYCSKDGDILRISGDVRSQGERSDLDRIRTLISEGASDLDIANANFASWCRYRRSFAEYRRLLEPRNLRECLRTMVHVGPTGIGKTYSVFQCEPDLYPWPGAGLWFDGYSNQPAVLFDDFDGSGVPYEYLLRLLDMYPLQVPVKGGFTEWNPVRIYITTNVPIEQWYRDRSDIKALQRRITYYRNDYE